jgi:hypothetical protein
MPTRDPREMMESEAYTAVGLAICGRGGSACMGGWREGVREVF